jgi:hypothetical protein
MLQSILKPNVCSAISQYTANYLEDLVEDRITLEDWNILSDLADILQKFQLATKITESRSATLSDVLPAIDFLLNTYSTSLAAAEADADIVLAAMLKYRWEMLDIYYSLTDRSPVYVAAVVLHLRHKWKYIKKHWKQEWIPPAQQHMLSFWNNEYKGIINPVEHKTKVDEVQLKENTDESWLFGEEDDSVQIYDEYDIYCTCNVERNVKTGLLQSKPLKVSTVSTSSL